MTYTQIVGQELSAPTPHNPPFHPQLHIDGRLFFGSISNSQGKTLWLGHAWIDKRLAWIETSAMRTQLLLRHNELQTQN